MTMVALKAQSDNTNVNFSQQQTQIAEDAKATIQAAEKARLTEEAIKLVTGTLEPPTQKEPSQGQTPQPTEKKQKSSLGDFNSWYKEASILLYEDMAGEFGATRDIKDTLIKMELNPVDVKDASGIFVQQIKDKGTNDEGWDLIISASEARKPTAGDFIPSLIEAVKNGSSLIWEQWNIDSMSSDKLKNFLSDCGVQFQQDFASVGPMGSSLALYPVDIDNPILNEPNKDLRISFITEYWSEWYKSINEHLYDYGDLLEKTINSKASIVLAAKNQEVEKNATLVSCYDGRVILWTSSTHNYGHDRIVPLWQNMIYNALKARYNYINSR
jgi:hypothetical protein